MTEASALRAIEFQKVHAGGMHGILSSLQKPSLNESVQGLGNLFHVVSHKRGDLFVGQESARVPVQENEQIKIAAVPYYSNASE